MQCVICLRSFETEQKIIMFCVVLTFKIWYCTSIASAWKSLVTQLRSVIICVCILFWHNTTHQFLIRYNLYSTFSCLVNCHSICVMCIFSLYRNSVCSTWKIATHYQLTSRRTASLRISSSTCPGLSIMSGGMPCCLAFRSRRAASAFFDLRRSLFWSWK